MEKINISKLRVNPDNPRTISDSQFQRLVESVKNAPWLLDLRPIVVDEEGMVLGGNMRLLACRKAGMKEVPVVFAKNLTDEERREFIVKDNLAYGEWDWDALREWDLAELEEWGLDVPTSAELSDAPSDICADRKFEVVVECDQESQQETVYNLLKQKGYKCRILTI